MKGSVTRLNFNKRGDVKHLKNWRTICLLNVDYKIISKAIALRLPKVLEHIVHPDQTCSVSGRSTFSNVSFLRDVLDYIQRTDESAILIGLDQEKALDLVNRPFLLKLCHVYSFGPDFYRWICTFYNGAFMQIIRNSWLTEVISLERGVGQGNLLSPLHCFMFFAWRSWPPSSAALLGVRSYAFLVPEGCRRVFACMLMTPR